ncbi:MAG TPA: hypothetical protein VEJ63_06195 [Planctomycetota bacterium]|nr:hypothetical protein [Planctomycetota bacterium]
MDDREGDRYRRIVRWGALLALIATVTPFEGNKPSKNLWFLIPEAFNIAALGDGREGVVLVIFATLILPVLLSGPCLLGCAAPVVGKPGRERVQRIGAASFLLAATLAPPCYFFQFHVREYTADQVQSQLLIGGLLLFLFIAGLFALFAWDRRRTYLSVLHLAMLPVVLNALAWVMLLLYAMVNPPTRREWLVWVMIALGFIGAGMMLYGWLRWFFVVRRAVRAHEAAMAPDRTFAEPR